jgi:hypothetical protein
LGVQGIGGNDSTGKVDPVVVNMGISLVLASTSTCAKTMPWVWSRAASRCRPSAVLDPRNVLPSTAISLRRSGVGMVRCWAQAPIWSSKASAQQHRDRDPLFSDMDLGSTSGDAAETRLAEHEMPGLMAW